MTDLEYEIIMYGNEVKDSLRRIYQMGIDVLGDNEKIVYLADGNTIRDYVDTLKKFNSKNFELFNPNYNGENDSDRLNFLENFDMQNKALMARYWRETIGFAKKEVLKKFNRFFDKYVEYITELDKKLKLYFDIPVKEFTEKLCSGVNERLKYSYNKYQHGAIDFKLVNDSRTNNNYYVIHSNDGQCDKLLSNAFGNLLVGKSGLLFLGKENGTINPYTASQFIGGEKVGYNQNILKAFENYPDSIVKNALIDVAKEIFSERVRDNMHEVLFTKFVLYANALEELWQAYKTSDDIFKHDLSVFNSKSKIKKAKKYLAINNKDAQEIVDEVILEFQGYLIDALEQATSPYYNEANRILSPTINPFPEFD